MKKFVAIFLFMLSVCANAQHMKFLGIPLDGTINSFHEKLVAKGYKPDTQYNAQCAPGGRLFLGTFFGKEAAIHTYYNPKTKIIYRAKACIEDNDKDRILHGSGDRYMICLDYCHGESCTCPLNLRQFMLITHQITVRYQIILKILYL